MTGFTITTTSVDGSPRIEARGELDIATAPELEREISALLALDGGDLALDLEPVTFIDSSGLRAVLVCSRRAREAGRRLLVRPGNGQVSRVIELSRAGEHLDLDGGPSAD